MPNRTYTDIMEGTNKNISFADLCFVLKKAGFRCRIKGDHYIFSREDIVEIINIQPAGNKAKPYQVRQVRLLFEKYNIQEGK